MSNCGPCVAQIQVGRRKPRRAEDLTAEVLPAVAIRFPAFADGRGLSLGSLLRSRCGFDAFALADERQAQTAIACMNRMSDHYQASVREPEPAFRRSTAG